jgi:hypothetical protein
MSNQVSANIIQKLLDEVDAKETRNTQNMTFLNTVVRGLKDKTLTIDRVQILDNGDMRIVPGEPPDKPVVPNANGKGAAKDTNPLADPVAAGQSKPEEASNGS